MSLLTRHTATVTQPDADIDADGVELTATQTGAVTYTGLLESLNSDEALREFGFDVARAFRWTTAIANAAAYVVGGQVKDVVLTRTGASVEAGPLYIAKAPEKHMGDNSTDNATVMLTA